MSTLVFAQIDGQNDLGTIDMTSRSVGDATRNFLIGNPQFFRGSGIEDFVVSNVLTDELGQTHVRFQPFIHGLMVYGSQIQLHFEDFSGRVMAVRGDFKSGEKIETIPRLSANRAISMALSGIKAEEVSIVSIPELSFVMNQQHQMVLAWNVLVEYQANGHQLDRVFAHAHTGQLANRHPMHHSARNRSTYDGNNLTSLPGSLVRSEGSGPSGDSCLDAAHDYAGITYDYYNLLHGRDSYDNAGATLHSTVHHRTNYNNAFWNGSQMVYGDGDGVTFICLAQSLDVVAHELTHAVTDRTANLVYQNESGALNESMSDIFGAATELFNEGGAPNANTWKLGETIYTPGTAGDALRYMNNPTQDGSSTDYYPTRYTGTADNGGVHWNSGISNLAFVLLTEGGSHPRGVTSNVVTGIGITDAAAIFYRALTVYMGPNTTFSEAREQTISAAADLFGAGSTQATQMGNAWTAVGVTPPPPTIELSNGQTISNLSGASGSWVYYKIVVPSGASNLSMSISGGSGDADLYTRFGAKPTSSTWDCRPFRSGNNESCSVATPSAGTYYMGIHAFSAYSGVSLTASYTGGGPVNQPPAASFSSSTNGLTASFTDTSSDPDGTIASRSWSFGDGGTSTAANPSHAYAAGGTYTVTLTVTDNDGATDSASASVTVTSPTNQPPVASFSNSTNNLTASFTDTSSDPDGSIASRSWSFGDGGTSSAANPNHTYASAGTYTVTLTVTDNNGASDSASASVTVTEPATDTVTITRVVYRNRKGQLTVEATTNDPNATLTLVGFGTMDNKGGGSHRLRLRNVANPGTVTVTSSSGGSDTRAVN